MAPKKQNVLKDGIQVGAKFYVSPGGWLEIIEVHGDRKIKIRFLEYPCEIFVKATQIRMANIKNPMTPKVCGVGYIGIGIHNTASNSGYPIWLNMLNRVHNPWNDSVRKRYSNISIHESWYNFQNFAQWFLNQTKHFDLVDFRWHLDKDLLMPGNRIYGPETCCVIPESINILLSHRVSENSGLPLGVRINGQKYQACCATYESEGSRYIGSYSTIREAQIAYWEAKFQAVHSAALWNWNYLPESLAMRLIQFGWNDAHAYYGDHARLREE